MQSMSEHSGFHLGDTVQLLSSFVFVLESHPDQKFKAYFWLRQAGIPAGEVQGNIWGARDLKKKEIGVTK